MSENETAIGWSRAGLAQRAADDVPDGSYVNLGIGIPMMIPARIPEGREVWFHTENGILGLGGVPAPDEIDLDVTNAGKEYARIEVGASIFDSSLSFAIVRGGHLDIAVLGGMETTPSGDLANWTAPGRTPGVGGAMDLVMGAKQVWVVMDHTDKRGRSKLMRRCTLPLTGTRCVTRIYTALGVFRPAGSHFECLELAPGVDAETVRELTDAEVVFVDATVAP
ncbi:MAG: 3-oxoacid CoA-transferase subunit B [Candidatus Nanopelagicales bacterium]